jgi:hypothetical protein
LHHFNVFFSRKNSIASLECCFWTIWDNPGSWSCSYRVATSQNVVDVVVVDVDVDVVVKVLQQQLLVLPSVLALFVQ